MPDFMTSRITMVGYVIVSLILVATAFGMIVLPAYDAAQRIVSIDASTASQSCKDRMAEIFPDSCGESL